MTFQNFKILSLRSLFGWNVNFMTNKAGITNTVKRLVKLEVKLAISLWLSGESFKLVI